MNRKVYELCAGLSDEERKRDAGAFFKSIHGTLNHLLLADRIWMGRFTGKPYPATSLDQEVCADFAELRAEREKEDAAIVAWADALTDEDLARELAFTSIVNPKPRRSPFAPCVAHFFNHQTHHRGQITTLLMQRGIDPGVTDLFAMPELQSPQA